MMRVAGFVGVAGLLLAAAPRTATAWPGMKSAGLGVTPHSHGLGDDDASHIGPSCTVGAHGLWPQDGPCPNMAQPSPPPSPGIPAHDINHTWPEQFSVQWKFYFVPDDSDTPPYTPDPKTPFNVTTGSTFYYHNATLGLSNMREVYEQYCIPVFGDPSSPMGAANNYSCEFLNVGATNTSFVVLHDDRPAGLPECCIIGKPFHPPPPTFAAALPVKWSEVVMGTVVDWNAVYDNEAGIFAYGFTGTGPAAGTPFAFYMKGVPWIANWMWQIFSDFQPVVPPETTWEVPSACATATRCPGW